MKLKDKGVSKKMRKFSVSTVLYIVATVVALLGVALLVTNIMFFRFTVNQYVAQGYPAADVIKSLLPSQLLPGIFEPIAVYGGISFVLLGVAVANKKISKYLLILTKDENCNDAIEESILEQNIDGSENTETIEQVEIIEQTEIIEQA